MNNQILFSHSLFNHIILVLRTQEQLSKLCSDLNISSIPVVSFPSIVFKNVNSIDISSITEHNLSLLKMESFHSLSVFEFSQVSSGFVDSFLKELSLYPSIKSRF